MASGATCVQRLDGSRDSAIHTKYRISLRSSSMREPRYPLPRVVMTFARHPVAPTRSANGVRGEDASLSIPWRIPRRGSLARTAWPEGARRRGRRARDGDRPRRTPPLLNTSSLSALQVSTMILPQVHLRKPCYDFSFL